MSEGPTESTLRLALAKEEAADAKKQAAELRASLARQLQLTAAERTRADVAEATARRAVQMAITFSRRGATP